MNIPDNYDLWEAHDIELERQRARRPICCHCGEHIQDDVLFDINGELYHIDCAETVFCQCTEEYEG